MGERALAMEGIMTTIMDTLNCTNFPTTLSMISTMNRDQATISQLKEELETTKKSNSDLTDKLENSEDIKMKIDATNREWALQKEIEYLKSQLEDERRQIDECDPQVKLSYIKLEYLLPISEVYSKTCTNFVSFWKEYYDKYEPHEEGEKAEWFFLL